VVSFTVNALGSPDCGTYLLIAGVSGVARDEKLRMQMFEITWRDKGWLG